MEAKLPDVNAGIVTHRKAIMNGYDNSDFTKCSVSFGSIIALLPEDYKPVINTLEYFEKIKGRRIISCDSCKKEHPRETIKPFEMVLSEFDRCILQEQICLVWTCPTCDNTRPLICSSTRNEQFQQPFYTGIIPEMPRRRGLSDRIGFEKRFNDWYEVAFVEIEHQIGLYRAEYQRQNPDEVLPDLDDA